MKRQMLTMMSLGLWACGVPETESSPITPQANVPTFQSDAGNLPKDGGLSGNDGGFSVADGGSSKTDGGVPAYKRVFVTSARYKGNLKALFPNGPAVTGLEAADLLCTRLAEGASLNGTFKAWLSSNKPTVSAIDRLADVGPWYQYSKSTNAYTKTFHNRSGLYGAPSEPIEYDEFGVQQSGYVWTGTQTGGLISSTDCAGFSSVVPDGTVGLAGSKQEWTQRTTWDCSDTARLYCFEQ